MKKLMHARNWIRIPHAVLPHAQRLHHVI